MSELVPADLLALQSPIAFFGHAEAKPGSEQTLLDLMLSIGEPSRAEPGVLVYEIHRDRARPGTIAFYELYADGDAVRSHLEQPHMQRFFAGSAELLAGELELAALTLLRPDDATEMER